MPRNFSIHKPCIWKLYFRKKITLAHSKSVTILQNSSHLIQQSMTLIKLYFWFQDYTLKGSVEQRENITWSQQIKILISDLPKTSSKILANYLSSLDLNLHSSIITMILKVSSNSRSYLYILISVIRKVIFNYSFHAQLSLLFKSPQEYKSAVLCSS